MRNEGIASNALKRIRQGYPFDQVSRQFSIDPQLKDAGGDMGWVAPSSIPAGLGKIVDGLRVGEVSQTRPGHGRLVRLQGARPQGRHGHPLRGGP